MSMFVIVAPGQGSQKPGFLGPWLEHPDTRSKLDAWSNAIGIDLAAHGTTSDEATIRDTQVAQPLIVAASLLTGRALLGALPADTPIRFAGHSVGEFAAAALAGLMSDDDAIALVAARGRAMAEASALTPTGMSAVIGADPGVVEAAATAASLYAANFNGAGQVVVAGAQDALAAFAEHPPAGSRVIPLSVAGAFHTPYMASAQQALAAAAARVEVHDPHHPLYTNRDGSLTHSAAQAIEYLVDQVQRPVRWDRCMESFADEQIQGMIELAPAGALVGLAKRELKGVATVAINTPEDLVRALELVGS